MPTRIARTVADAPSTNDRTFLFIGASLSALDLIPVAPWAISLRIPREYQRGAPVNGMAIIEWPPGAEARLLRARSCHLRANPDHARDDAGFERFRDDADTQGLARGPPM